MAQSRTNSLKRSRKAQRHRPSRVPFDQWDVEKVLPSEPAKASTIFNGDTFQLPFKGSRSVNPSNQNASPFSSATRQARLKKAKS